MQIKDKRVLVLGLGRSGLAAIDALLKRGAHIAAYDRKPAGELEDIPGRLQQHGIHLFAATYPQFGETYDFLVVSPGIPLEIPPLVEAFNRGIPVLGELELAYYLKSPGVKIFAITGTNGKTTTTALLEHILQRAGIDARAGGNIGVPLVQLLEDMEEGAVALEVSSFQLETISTFRADVAAILNITPDHLDRHKTMENYINIKEKIFLNQGGEDYAVLNFEDPLVRELATRRKSKILFFSHQRPVVHGVYLESGKVWARFHGPPIELCQRSDIPLRGNHNMDNVLCAAAMAMAAGVDRGTIQKAIKDFAGVRHRLEEVAFHKGIYYVNDSKATNPDSTIKALEAFQSPVILIAGGRNKGADFSNLAGVIRNRVKAVILLGEAREEMAEALLSVGYTAMAYAEDLTSAVYKASAGACPGDTVLLSPACASWDMFDNYEQRGDLFCSLVKNIR